MLKLKFLWCPYLIMEIGTWKSPSQLGVQNYCAFLEGQQYIGDNILLTWIFCKLFSLAEVKILLFQFVCLVHFLMFADSYCQVAVKSLAGGDLSTDLIIFSQDVSSSLVWKWFPPVQDGGSQDLSVKRLPFRTYILISEPQCRALRNRRLPQKHASNRF